MIDIIETPSSLIKQILVQSFRKQVVYGGHWLVNLIQFIKVKYVWNVHLRSNLHLIHNIKHIIANLLQILYSLSFLH